MSITDKPLGYAWIEKYTGLSSLIQQSYYTPRHFLAETRREKEMLSQKEDITSVWSQNLLDAYPKMDLVDHMCYALKNEGIDLSLLSAVFPIFGEAERKKIADIISETPKSRDSSARKLGYMYEAIAQKEIPLDSGTLLKTGYDLLFSPNEYYTAQTPNNISAKYKITDNAIGDVATLCPIIRRTRDLEYHCGNNYMQPISEFIENIDSDIIIKACDRIAKGETQHSYIYEKDTKDAKTRIEKFKEAMLGMDTGLDYTLEDNLVKLQNTIASKYKQDTAYRDYQNFIGSFVGARPYVSYLPIRPGLLRGYMGELNKLYRKMSSPDCGIDPILAGSVISCYFVLAHPFADGNGRISRFLAQNVWMKRGYNGNLIIPISEALACGKEVKKDYIEALSNITAPMMKRVEYSIAHRVDGEYEYFEPEVTKCDIRTYAYPDLTAYCTTMYDLVKDATQLYMPQAIIKTQIIDRIKKSLGEVAGEKRIGKLVDMCMIGDGVLSKNKRRLFRDIPSEIISKIENIVSSEYDNFRNLLQPEADIDGYYGDMEI